MAAERHRRTGVGGWISVAAAPGWNVASAIVHIRANETFSGKEVVLGRVGHGAGVDAVTDDRCYIDFAALCRRNVGGDISADIQFGPGRGVAVLSGLTS